MTDAFDFDHGRIRVVQDSDIAFDTERPSLQLFPDDTKISWSGNVIFPSFLTAIAYFNRSSGGFGTTYCQSWTSLYPQEWGPDQSNGSPTHFPGNSYPGPATRNLPSTLLGTVPGFTDHLDVRVNLSRVDGPPSFFNQAVPDVMFQEGAWNDLVDGACPTERFYPMARLFEVVMSSYVNDDTPRQVLLNRYQSIEYDGVKMSWVSGGAVSGWHRNTGPAYGGYNNDLYEFGIPSILIEQRGPDITGNKRAPWYATATNSCSAAIPDTSSTYTGTIEIHPGRYRAATA